MATRGLSFRDVERLQPRAKAYEVPDPGQAGAIWRVQPSNIKSGIAVYGRGKRVTHELHFPSLTPPAHRAWVRKALSEAMDHGAPLDAKPKGKAGDVKTLEDFLTMRYTEVIEDRKAKDATLAAIRAVFKDLLDKPLAAITSWHMAQFKARRKKAGIAPATINRDLDRIRAALNSAVNLKLLASNPVVGVDRLKVENERVRYLLPDEEKRLRKALIERDTERRQQRASGNAWAKVRGYNARHAWMKDEYTDHLAPLVLVAINTGLRRGELFGLTWGRVNLERAQLEVAASTAKTGKVRHVPLNAEALDVLTRWKKQGSGEGLVFPGGEATRLTNINKAWASLVQAAEIEDFHFHDLRHHFASRLMMTGADLYTVSKLLGHSDPKMTQRYAHLSPEHNAAAVARLMAKR